jgi:hypothetical protein
MDQAEELEQLLVRCGFSAFSLAGASATCLTKSRRVCSPTPSSYEVQLPESSSGHRPSDPFPIQPKSLRDFAFPRRVATSRFVSPVRNRASFGDGYWFANGQGESMFTAFKKALKNRRFCDFPAQGRFPRSDSVHRDA